jgi:hypothetical protein
VKWWSFRQAGVDFVEFLCERGSAQFGEPSPPELFIEATGCFVRVGEFEQGAGSGAHLGSVPYAAYHSARDLPRVIDPDQIVRAGRVATAWIRNLTA